MVEVVTLVASLVGGCINGLGVFILSILYKKSNRQEIIGESSRRKLKKIKKIIANMPSNSNSNSNGSEGLT